MARGRFITFEGGEGAGKSTQIARLADHLTDLKMRVVQTREPGGTLGAEQIRALLVRGPAQRWDAVSEAFLNFAARRDHVEQVIRPALASGAWVLCDRFTDSTLAYQGYAGGMDVAQIEHLSEIAINALKPDLTFIIDVPIEVGLDRADSRADADDRFEGKGRAFHKRLRQAFLSIAEREPSRCQVIDGEQSEEEVALAIRRKLSETFGITP